MATTGAWPSCALRILNFVGYSIALSANVGIVSRRLTQYAIFARFDWRSNRWVCDVALLLAFASSLAFTFLAGWFYYGMGVLTSDMCKGAIVLCVSVRRSSCFDFS
jgi:hypothetical protein